MELYDKAYLACLQVKKAHAEISLIDYQRVMKHYDPSIEAFDIILNEVDSITQYISNLDKAISEV